MKAKTFGMYPLAWNLNQRMERETATTTRGVTMRDGFALSGLGEDDG